MGRSAREKQRVAPTLKVLLCGFLPRFSGGLWSNTPTFTRLPNGLQLIVEHDPNAPLVAIEVWVQAGVACETPETSGVAHLLEHLIFKGTVKDPPGTLDEVCESAGGVLTAHTERDWVRYSVSVLSEHWRRPLQTLLEHLRRPLLPPDELEKERQIILRDEYALHEADPIRPVRYRLYAQAFPKHPYGLPLLGDPALLKILPRQAVLEFHQRYYRPERIVVVVVGNVSEPAVRAIVESVWGDQPAGEPPPTAPVSSPIETHRFHEISGVLVYSLPAPPAHSVEAMLATEVLRLVLGEPYLGLLYEGEPPPPFGRVITDYLPRLQSGLMSFFFLPPAESNNAWQAQVQRRWERAIERIRNRQARPQIEQAKSWLIQRHRNGMRNPIERARIYGFYATLNLPHLPIEYEQRVAQLTPEQVETLVEMLWRTPPPTTWSLPSAESSSPPPSPSPPMRAEPAKAVRQRYANGLRAIAIQQPERETTLIHVLIRTDGSEFFPSGTDELTARLLFTTTQNETLQTMGYRIAMSGGSFQVFWESNATRIVAYTRPNALGNVLSTLAEAILRPQFDATHLQRAVRQAVWDRRWSEGTQEWRLYAQLSPHYASEETLRKPTHEQIQQFYRMTYRPERVVFVVAGPHPPERMLAEIGRYFSSEWHEHPASPAQARPEPPAPSRKMGVCEAPYRVIYMGYLQTIATVTPQDYLQALLRHAVLTEGKRSRLFQEYRERLGRGYGVRGQFALRKGAALLAGFVQFGAINPDTRQRFLKRLDALCQAPPTPEEQARARALLIGQWYRNRYNSEDFTRQLGLAELFGWGYELEMGFPQALNVAEPSP